jgi:hypothetical protein
MTRWSSCGLLLACELFTTPSASAQAVAGPRTAEASSAAALALARTLAPAVRASPARGALVYPPLRVVAAGAELEAAAAGQR